MLSWNPWDCSLLDLLTFFRKDTRPLQTLSPTTTCTAGTSMTHLSCRPFFKEVLKLSTTWDTSGWLLHQLSFVFVLLCVFFPMTCDAVGLSGFTNSFVFSEILLMPFQFLLEKMRPRRAAPLHRWETISSELFCKYMPMFSLK